MAKLNEEFFDKIAAKIIEKGVPDDLAKFMLSGEEHIAAVQRYFYNLEADKKKELNMIDDEWFLGLDRFRNPFKKQRYTGVALFKLIAFSIIPHVEKLYIINTQLDDYSFLKDIKNLRELWLGFEDQEHTKVLSALSSLQSVNYLTLDIKGLNLQLVSSLCFSFRCLMAYNFVFEADPKCDKAFQAQEVSLYGDEEAMNDFVFNRQNFQNYVDVFPNAIMYFEFYIKLVYDVSGLLKLSRPDYIAEVEIPYRDIRINYNLFDYSGHPNSKVLRMLRKDGRWDTDGCPYEEAYFREGNVEMTCSFPLAIKSVADRLAQKRRHRIPQNTNGRPEDYLRLTIGNIWGHRTEFEILKGLSKEEILEAYGEIIGISAQYLRCYANFENISNGGFIHILHEYQ